MRRRRNIREFRLDRESTAAAIAYLASRLDKPDYYRLGHLIYLADLKHLAVYGRTITGDRYFALPHGPVPTHTYAALQAVAGVEPIEKAKDVLLIEMLSRLLEHESGNDFRVRTLPDLGPLSESDTDCLDEVIATWGSASFGEIQDATHDPAWVKNWHIAERKGKKSQPIPLRDILEILPSGELVAEYLADPHPS